jgi:ABC-type amino acid transport substrate-binding protein
MTNSDQFEKVIVHSLFSPNRYSAGFNDMELKKQFNHALGKYMSFGRYKALKAKYNFKDLVPTIKVFPVD